MSFYVTLPSDSSMNYFPENKISHFITRLPVPIELKGMWEVGLVELLYPHTWHNVNADNNLIGFVLEKDGEMLGRRLPPGCYETVPDILKAIYIKEHQNKIIFNYNPVTKRVKIKVKNNAKVILHDGLAQMLGFEPMEITSTDDSSETVVESPFAADPCAHYRVLMIYTDIVEPQIVGDVLAPLLRIVRVTGSDGEVVSALFDRPHYLPVNRKMIDTLEIDIRTHMGAFTPFERGRSYVKLHC
ncbi:uncharacterized protein LOC118206051 [Stegodyphus dumicola]|nr:uncharacterized protein LOC118179692 [Stegodyphus dumicola]XP_035206813.1 uncharacterized protein LOC118181728 [Stegodyphus dumicola]XP_035210017.1 uncharacterized protein LOC118184457 [Stegodyphus dumicola]XP_035221906.1 uncharacterized protein LOC118194809 [Stegodyphus dumicola]XP_035225999.1 uncharacterized protein LOC118198434 [Stegodyphus dumicola]XP_035233269.1 uncharacterized protein LOC118205090 [Stegodyphus dumicola]XP_035234221.1 uncharacterized protein LOC118206051 [Stegodyphus 